MSSFISTMANNEIVTCTKAHALMDGCGRVLEFPNGDFGQVERAVDDWRRRQQNHQLLGHSYHVGGYPQPYVSVMSKLWLPELSSTLT
jgi:hypothetical protein